MARGVARDVGLTLVAAAAGPAAAAAGGLLRSPDMIPRLTQDVFLTGKFSPLTGLLSNLGAFLWFGTLAILALAAALLRPAGQRAEARFLMLGALLTFYLWFDDFFMFHEAVARRYLGIDEKVVYGILGLLGATYLAGFRMQIYRTPFLWLLGALGCLGLSILSDLFAELLDNAPGDWWFVVEDGLKWCGIVLWARYHVGVSARLLRRRMESSRSEMEHRPLAGSGRLHSPAA